MQLSEIKDKSAFCWQILLAPWKICGMEGMQVPIACLKTQVTTGAMQRLLAASVRGKLVGLGHSPPKHPSCS